MNRSVLIADSETDPFKRNRIPEPFLWGVYDGDNYEEFTQVDQFVDFIQDKECIVYAHNGGKFDWHFLLHRLEQFDEIMVINGRLAKFKIGQAEFRDSYNILPMPLSAWKKDDFDYDLMEKSKRHIPENWRKIRKYLRHDCEYLYDIVSKFIDTYGFNLTQAGAAMKIWKKITGNKAPSTSKEFYEKISEYYYGGRVECFKHGIIPHDFKVVDINSAYPHAMKKLHPYGDSYEVSNSLPNSDAYISRCFISLECLSRGAFPFRSKQGLVFPNDNTTRLFHVTGWEYLAAIKTKTISNVKIKKVIQFNDSIEFGEYIDHFYKIKTDAKNIDDKANYIFAKLFLNSLYGKFGANPENYNEYTIVEPRFIEAAEEDGYNFCAELGPWALVSRSLNEEQERYYNVAVAASITGFVRAYLWQAIRQCKGVMYCDTDSIACRDTGSLSLHATNLGAWDIEAECDYGGIGGKKLYAFHTKDGNWKTASKGVRLNPVDILKVASGDKVIYKPDAPSFSLKRGIKFVDRNVKMT